MDFMETYDNLSSAILEAIIEVVDKHKGLLDTRLYFPNDRKPVKTAIGSLDEYRKSPVFYTTPNEYNGYVCQIYRDEKGGIKFVIARLNTTLIVGYPDMNITQLMEVIKWLQVNQLMPDDSWISFGLYPEIMSAYRVRQRYDINNF